MSHVLKDILQKYNTNRIFVETGSYLGNGIATALNSDMFDEIHSIEINKLLFEHCQRRFENEKTVKLHLGDSGKILKDIVNRKEGITFWLDAHYSGGKTGCAKQYLSPIEHELEIIKASPAAKKHIILIDDMKDFMQKSIDWNRKTYSIDPGYMPKYKLYTKLREINPHFNIHFLNVKRGVCVATPY